MSVFGSVWRWSARRRSRRKWCHRQVRREAAPGWCPTAWTPSCWGSACWVSRKMENANHFSELAHTWVNQAFSPVWWEFGATCCLQQGTALCDCECATNVTLCKILDIFFYSLLWKWSCNFGFVWAGLIYKINEGFIQNMHSQLII